MEHSLENKANDKNNSDVESYSHNSPSVATGEISSFETDVTNYQHYADASAPVSQLQSYQDIADNSSQVTQLQSYQDIANSSYQVAQLQSFQNSADNSTQVLQTKSMFGRMKDAGSAAYNKASEMGGAAYNKASEMGGAAKAAVNKVNPYTEEGEANLRGAYNKASEIKGAVYDKSKELKSAAYEKAAGYGETAMNTISGLKELPNLKSTLDQHSQQINTLENKVDNLGQ